MTRVLVVGGGIGGLTAGATLAQRGLETDVVEIRPGPGALGVGLHLRANALRALKTVGVLDDIRSAGFAYNRTIYRDYHDRHITDVCAQPGGDGIPATVSLLRPRMHEILAAAAEHAGARIAYGTTVTELVDNEDRVHVTFSDGRQADYDVVAAFDGIHSQQRRRLFGARHDAVETGHAIWRIPLPRSEQVTTFTLFVAPTTVAGYTPLGDDSMYLFVIAPKPEDAREDEPHLALLRERLAGFRGHVAELRDSLGSDDEVHFHLLSEVMLPLPWSTGRVIVLGDAAHACNPQAAQGAAMAIEDAVVLAEELTSDESRPIPTTLEAVSRRRYPRIKFVQDAGRALRRNVQVTEETLPIITKRMAADMPAQRKRADTFLNQPA